MTFKMIKKELFSVALALGACKEELDALRAATSIDDLFRLYWENINFCIKHNIPSLGVFRRVLEEVSSQQLIYIDQALTLNPEVDFKAVFLGDCRTTINIKTNQTARIFARHTSELTVHAAPGSMVVIDLFDQSKAIIHGGSKAKISVFKMGGGHVEGDGVRVFEKQLKP